MHNLRISLYCKLIEWVELKNSLNYYFEKQIEFKSQMEFKACYSKEVFILFASKVKM